MANQKYPQPAQTVTWSNATSATTYPVTLGNIMTSTGLGPSFGGFGPSQGTVWNSNTNFEIQHPILHATNVYITKDGLTIEAGLYRIQVPHKLLSDVVALSEMGLLDKLAPETEEPAKP